MTFIDLKTLALGNRLEKPMSLQIAFPLLEMEILLEQKFEPLKWSNHLKMSINDKLTKHSRYDTTIYILPNNNIYRLCGREYLCMSIVLFIFFCPIPSFSLMCHKHVCMIIPTVHRTSEKPHTLRNNEPNKLLILAYTSTYNKFDKPLLRFVCVSLSLSHTHPFSFSLSLIHTRWLAASPNAQIKYWRCKLSGSKYQLIEFRSSRMTQISIGVSLFFQQ